MGQGIDQLEASEFVFEVWSAADLREEFPEDEEDFTDNYMGVLFAGSNRDGIILIGTAEQVREKLQRATEQVAQRINGSVR